MKVFTLKGFTGAWPVPTAAVCAAMDQEAAAKVFAGALARAGLAEGNSYTELLPKVQYFDATRVNVRILSDGEY